MPKIKVTDPPLWPEPLEMAELCHDAVGRMLADEAGHGNIFGAVQRTGQRTGETFAALCAQVEHVLCWLNSDKRHTLSRLRERRNASGEGLAHGAKSAAEGWTGEHVWVARDVYEATCAWWLAAYDARQRRATRCTERNLKPVTQIRRSAEVADGELRWSCWGTSWIVPLADFAAEVRERWFPNGPDSNGDTKCDLCDIRVALWDCMTDAMLAEPPADWPRRSDGKLPAEHQRRLRGTMRGGRGRPMSDAVLLACAQVVADELGLTLAHYTTGRPPTAPPNADTYGLAGTYCDLMTHDYAARLRAKQEEQDA